VLRSYALPRERRTDVEVAPPSHGLRTAAHTLKGAVGLFAAAEAVDSAQRLEQMGQRSEFSAAAVACDDLEQQAGRVHAAIAALLTNRAACEA